MPCTQDYQPLVALLQSLIKSQRGGLSLFAHTYGHKPSSVTEKFNPNNTKTWPTIPELIEAIQFTNNDPQILEHLKGLFAVDDDVSCFNTLLNSLRCEAAEFNLALNNALADGVLTDKELGLILKEATENLAALQRVIGWAQAELSKRKEQRG